jgi:fucose 4-O-acetylase-like acetyltransferase
MARDNRIDSLKGFLIILVILGHLITTLDNTNVVNHAVMGLIYVFHMPLFILISGYLTKSPERQTAREMWRGVGNIFITLMVFQFLDCFRVYLYGSNFFFAMKNFPFGVLWYLLSLIYWRIMLYYTPKALLNRPALYLVIAVAASVLCGLTHLGRFLSIQRTLNFYMFFLLGYYYRQGVLPTRWWKNNWLHGAVAVILLPLIFWLFPHCGSVMNGADHYYVSGIPGKVMILACSVAVSLLVFNLFRDFDLLRRIGVKSLFYYVYHIIILAVVIVPLVKHFEWPRTLPFMLIYTAVILLILFLMSKVRFFNWLVRPTWPWRHKEQ